MKIRFAAVLLIAGVLVVSEASAQKRRAVPYPAPPAPPSANGDAYSLTRGATLSVPADEGVLANDTDPGARALTAILVTGVAHGTLTLNADGSFTYVNNGSTATSDAFTYKASNGASESAAATVTLSVNAPPAEFDFEVTVVSGPAYRISGFQGNNPTVTLQRGRTYKFKVQTPGHPFRILDAPAGSVTNNGITNGTLTFAVPTSPSNYEYICDIHSFMTGTIVTTQ